MSVAGSVTRTDVEELIYRTFLTLDARDFEGYLALWSPDLHYSVRAFSPEIRRDMVWMDLDRSGLETLFRTLGRHNSDPSPLTRHATVCTVALDVSRQQATVVSALQVFRTELDGGETQLFAVGKVHDTVTLAEGGPRLRAREIRLETRRLGIGSHIPF